VGVCQAGDECWALFEHVALGFIPPAVLPGVSISPSHGYGKVLPGERRQLAVQCQPLLPGLQFFELTCKTTAGRTFCIEGKVEGLQPELTLSHNVIKVRLLPQLLQWSHLLLYCS